MSDPQPRPERPERPVVNGIVALVAVALGVGLVLGVVTLVGSRALVGGGETASEGTGVRQSMYLPSPQETESEGGPRITLNTSDAAEEGTATGSAEPSDEMSSSSPAAGQISLQSQTTQVAAGDRIYFSGVYPGGEGQILVVERFQNGAWTEFPASVNVNGGAFSSYLFTGVAGENRFRVVDRENNVTSNEIKVQVG